MRTYTESAHDTPTHRIVIVCAPARPMYLPNRPATAAASSGSMGMARSTVGFIARSALQRVHVLDVDAAPFAEQHDQDGEPDGRFGRRHREHEKDEYLAIDVAQEAREGDEVEIRRQQQQL